MIEILELQSYCFPLGGEIDLTWVFSEPCQEKDEFYVFKSLKEIKKTQVDAYFKDGKKDDFNSIRKINTPGLLTAVDWDIETGTEYYYAVVVRRLDEENNWLYSEVHITHLTADEQTIEFNVIPTKKLVANGMKKIVKTLSGDKEAIMEVSNKYPMATDNQRKGISVVRATSDIAQRFWSNLSSYNSERFIRGEVDAETINVIWWTAKNPDLRDKITDLMKAAKFSLQRYLQTQYEYGVQVAITMQADQEEYEPKTGEHIFMSGLFVYFLIENQLIAKNPNSFLKKLEVELNFIEQKS